MEGGWTWIWFQGKPSLSLIPGELWNINCKVCPASRQGSRALETLRLPTPFRATPPTLQRISRDLDGTPTASATGPHLRLRNVTYFLSTTMILFRLCHFLDLCSSWYVSSICKCVNNNKACLCKPRTVSGLGLYSTNGGGFRFLAYRSLGFAGELTLLSSW